MRSGGSLLSFVLLGFGFFFLVHASDVSLTCYDGKALSFVQCNPGELCYNNTFAFIPGDDYSCKTKDYCDSHNYTADSCTSSIELHGCCCDFDYCNDPRDAPTTIPTPPSGQTWPPPLTCFDGVTQGFIQCQPWQVCYNNSLALIPGDDWGCRSRDYCASHNLTLDGCSSWLTLHGCCCDFDYCNDPADAPKTTTPIPTPPSGQTWGPGLKCFDGVSYSFITCQPWELCYNNSLALLPGDDWGCRSIDYCSQHNLTVDSCQSALTLHGCCCDFDYCNDPRDAPTPTTPVPTPPSGQTWPPNLVCYQDGDYGDGQWVTCKPGEVCYNSSLLADGCKSRDFCANNNLTIDGCESLGLLHGCCCDFNYCNNPGHGPTTAPTPPSGGTWPPPLWCYSNVGDDYDDPGFVQCKPWEICYNASSLIIFEDYGCVTRDWCASHNATSQDGSGALGCGHQGLGTDCCCDTDWCNNPREAPPFPSTSPKPTGPTTPPLTACPAGWTESNSQSQKCYIVPGTSDTYTAAVQACKQLYGSSLAVSIANGFENSEIRDMAGRDTLWIGLEKKSSDWAWSDGSTQTYRNWATGEPAATGSCSTLTVGDGKWRAQDCSQSFPIVCELTY